MAIRNPTHEDLVNLENKIKLEISKEQTELRHQQNGNIQKYMVMVDDLKTDLALNSQTQKSMLEQLKEMKSDIKKQSDDQEKYHRELMDKLDGKYAGKWVEKSFLAGIGIIAIAIIGALLKLILR